MLGCPLGCYVWLSCWLMRILSFQHHSGLLYSSWCSISELLHSVSPIDPCFGSFHSCLFCSDKSSRCCKQTCLACRGCPYYEPHSPCSLLSSPVGLPWHIVLQLITQPYPFHTYIIQYRCSACHVPWNISVPWDILIHCVSETSLLPEASWLISSFALGPFHFRFSTPLLWALFISAFLLKSVSKVL